MKFQVCSSQSKVTVISDIIVILIAGAIILAGAAIRLPSPLDVSEFVASSYRYRYRLRSFPASAFGRNVEICGTYVIRSRTATDAAIIGITAFGNLLNGNFHSFFQFYGNGNKQVDTNRWSYLSDGQVDGCHDTECYQVIAKGFADRKHNRDKNVHGRVCIDKTSCDQENDIDDQQECKLIMCNTSEQIGSCLRNTELWCRQTRTGKHLRRSA